MTQREIKFRGLRKNGHWLHGNCVKNPNGETFITKTLSDDNAFFHSNVRPETVGQYTELKDKNGVEIYEGDVVLINRMVRRFPDEELEDNWITTVISFSNGAFWYRGDGYTDCNWHFYDIDDREVIGNIYENPELLEVSE